MEQLAGAARLLVALDFDGTLAPIAPTAERAQILSTSARALARLASLPGTTVAILSGRDLANLLSKVPDAHRYWLGGSHGRTLIPPGGNVPDAAPDPRLAPYRELLLLPGVRRELKSFSVAFHWRGRTGGEPKGWIEQLRRRAQSEGLEVMDGRMVLEVLLPGVGKDDALARVVAGVDAEAVVFAGDDRTDLEAIRYASKRGMGIFVLSAERAWMAPEGLPALDDPEALAAWLHELADAREAKQASA